MALKTGDTALINRKNNPKWHLKPVAIVAYHGVLCMVKPQFERPDGYGYMEFLWATEDLLPLDTETEND